MVGQWTVTKPSRSDEVLDADQQLEIANQIRAQFDSLAPKRPTKPNRSEPDSTTPTDPSPVVTTMDHGIPELDKLRFLQSQSHVYVKFSVEGDTVEDEFVETEYYKELGFIDKQHHTTGTGFIRVVREEGNEDACHALHLGTSHGASADKPAFASNPATNDWIPSNEEEDRVFVSSKPSRSESSYPDPNAKEPDHWDEDEDGIWRAPKVPNPAYKGKECKGLKVQLP